MNTSAPTNPYKHHRFPAEIISHGVWLYYRFCLSYRDVEELLFARGVIVTYEAIRQWCRKFGQSYANQLRRRRPRPGDKWHLDEVLRTLNKERHYLWRAVDQDGHVLDILVQHRRDKHAAKKFFHFHPTLAGVLGTTLIRHQVVQMREPRDKRLLAPAWVMEPFHHEQFPVDGVMSLIPQRAGHRHTGVFEDRIPARFLGPHPLPYALAVGRSIRVGDVVRKAA
jgi:DDE domain